MKVLKIQFFSISTPHILELSHIFQIFTWAAHVLILSISVLFFFFSLSVQCSHSVVSDSWRPHGLQHTRLPCPSPTPSACSNSCPSSWWCHPTISPSVIPFSSCLQSFPASGSFQIGQFFASGDSASASVLPMNIQDWFLLGWTGLISLQSKGLSRIFSSTTVQKHQFFGAQFLYGPTLTSIHEYWKNHSFD